MQPEPGDERTNATRNDVSSAFADVGVGAGDVVMFHSSLSSMGHVVGGPETVINGALDAVGPRGTVAVPTLCNWKPGKQSEVFAHWNVQCSASYVGLITEWFRQRPDALRSDHATHSVAAIGARARDLTAAHGCSGPRRGPFGPRAFARESPWQRLYEWDAAYCFIGVTFRVCTMVHYVESCVVERALHRLTPNRRQQAAKAVAGWMEPGVWPTVRVPEREDIERMLADQGLVRYGKIGSATLRCARARRMVDEWIRILESAPHEWWPDEFVQWWREADEA